MEVCYMARTSQRISQEREYKIVKANALIQKSRFNLSVQEQKIVLYLITKIMPEDQELKLYEFKIQEFCQICGIEEDNGKNYINLKKIIKSLRDKSIWLQMENGDETTLSWIDQVTVSKFIGYDKTLSPAS